MRPTLRKLWPDTFEYNNLVHIGNTMNIFEVHGADALSCGCLFGCTGWKVAFCFLFMHTYIHAFMSLLYVHEKERNRNGQGAKNK